MLEFPKWFNEMLPDLSCPSCKKGVKESDITGEGIRKCMNNSDQTAFFIEYCCSKCGKSITMELNKMTLEEFTMELLNIFTEDIDALDELEEIPDPSDNFLDEVQYDKEKEEIVSKMTQLEVDNVKRVIRESASHHDFMMQIGITDDDLKQYEKEYNNLDEKKKKT